jgi:hypothetical protein
MVSYRRAVAAPMRYFDGKASSEAQGALPSPVRYSGKSGCAARITAVARQALCNAPGASCLHWVWAIDASSGSRLSFQGGRVAPVSRHDARRNRRQLSVTLRWLVR